MKLPVTCPTLMPLINMSEPHAPPSLSLLSNPTILFILACEACERFCYYSVRSLLVLLLQDQGFSKPSSVSLSSFWISACYLSPLLGAALSDARWGRFATISRFGVFYLLGMAALTAGGALRQVALTQLGLYAVAFGAGGIKPCVGPFGADQLAALGGAELSDSATTSYFFAFYVTINVGSLLAYAATPLMRAGTGFFGALLLPTAAMAAAMALFFAPRASYAHAPPGGSALLAVGATVRAACCSRARGGTSGAGASQLRRAADQEQQPLMAAAPLAPSSPLTPLGPEPPLQPPAPVTGTWLDSALDAPGVSGADVLNAAAVWRLLPLLCALPFFWAVFDAHSSVWLLQAEAMDLCFGAGATLCIQPDQMPVLNPILVVCIIPFLDRCVLPLLKRVRGLNPTPLRRMAVGLFLSTGAFAVSGLLQAVIEGGGKPHVSWQVGQYALLTVAEVCVSATGLEFFYAEAPPAMKSVVLSLFFLTTAAGDFLNGVLYGSLGFLPTSALIWVTTGLNAGAAVGFVALAVRFVPRSRGGGNGV